MPIVFHENSKTFHLYNGQISYIFCILKNGQLGQLYFGKKIHDREDFSWMLDLGARDMTPYPSGEDRSFSLESIKQEYPSFGSGDMRYPAFQIKQENGSEITAFTYAGHSIFAGKKKLEGLPAVYVETDEEACSLEVSLEDPLIGMRMILSYTIFEELPVICRNVRFVNDGETAELLSPAMSFNLDLPDKEYDMVDLTGAWARERYVNVHRLHEGTQSVYSMRGHSSHEFNPFFALKRPNADEMSGEVFGFSLVYSGNFLGMVNVDTYGTARVMMGIHPEGFVWTLHKGESFQTPEAVMVYSDQGLNGMSQTFHKLYRTRLARGYWRDRTRPVLINNWEATYMDFDEEKILQIARTAAELGIELLVLDDGWFGERNDTTSSLGDWYPNLKKLPGGLKGLAEKVTDLGLKFGLWFEPEMVNEDSELYRAHPDWVLAAPGRKRCLGRNQYVLDFTKPEVVSYVGDQIEEILQNTKISYVKWDMNRSITEVFSTGRDFAFQTEVYHRQILGVYALYERLTSRFPHILFESCASGGARFDPGMLYYAPQTWTSDNTDAAERLRIQYGTSMVYPLSSMGCHVSAVPNHQTGRVTSLKTRAETAFFGMFGYELDPCKLTPEEKEEVRAQICFAKTYQELIREGKFYRLQSPFEKQGEEAAWMVAAEDQSLALVGYYRIRQPSNAAFKRLKLAGLSGNALYLVKEHRPSSDEGGLQGEFYGSELMQAGLPLSDEASGLVKVVPELQGDYQSRIFTIEMRDNL